MKKLIYLLIMLGVVSSCQVTDLEPYDSISETLAFTTPDKIELSMNGVYDAAQSGFYGGNEANNRGYIFGAAFIQQNDMRGEDMLLINIFYAFTNQATYTTTTANNVNYWENGFRLVNLANLFIEGVQGAIDGGVIDQATGDSYIGEATLLRALAYQEMIIMFARPYRDGNGASPGLPIHTKGVNSSDAVDTEVQVGRSTVAETYAFILSDLDAAEQLLPESREGALNVVRATKGAAIALKTRVYLHMGNYAKVIEESNKLVPTSGALVSPINDYQMTASVDGPFTNNESSDNIFSMNMGPNDNLNVNAALANMYGSSAFDARGEVAISPIIWNESFWDPDDLRRTLLVASGASGRLFTTKYRDYLTNTDLPPIIRYTEVILNLAEAEARSGDQGRALDLLNAVRDRAISGAMTSYGTFATQNGLIQAILNERRIEFLAEGQRWKDIHRNAVDPDFSTLGIPAKMISADVDGSTYSIGNTTLTKNIGFIPYSDYRFLWPLPASETSANPVLAAEQNPGY
ncbi:MAG: RagB/SusD family nutrient uptake outer membrane protein [Cyclobacteriaceae bacterium]|nr:RagB/SusD family nutrient uptake outer membrane protein [Cyclobacteriaceae bacterium]